MMMTGQMDETDGLSELRKVDEENESAPEEGGFE
jgi:hypothetical protein